MKNENFLWELLSKVSVSGAEEESQAFIAEYMKPYADEVRRDEIGDVVCVLNPQAERKILLAAHGDEIGLIVNYITPEGFLHVIKRGGIFCRTYPGQKVKIVTENGVVSGVVVISSDLLKKQELEVTDLLIDIGVQSEEEAAKLVTPGDVAVFDTEIRKLANGRFTSRALDDKLGVFIIMEALKRAKERGCQIGVYSAATVGEETNTSGAYFTAARVKPDLAVIVDVTWVSDYPGMKPETAGKVLLGGGPVLCDNQMVARKDNRQMKAIARKAGIPVQMEFVADRTKTDGDKIHYANEGVPIVLVSIPLRYMHSPSEVADEKDVENCIALVTEFLMEESEKWVK